MIVKMKKITLLVSEKMREPFLLKLREAGVLHIRHVKAPVAHDIQFVDDRISKIEKMISTLTPYAGKPGKSGMICEDKELLESAEKTAEARDEKEGFLSEIRSLRQKIVWFDAWGEFEPEELEKIREKGVGLRLYRLKKEDFRRLAKKIEYRILKKEKGYIYVAVVNPPEDEALAIAEAQPPSESAGKIRTKINGLEEKVKKIEDFLREKAVALTAMKDCKARLEKAREFLSVKYGMQEEEQFAYLQGFCPTDRIKNVVTLAESNRAGYLVEEPDNPEETPTLIKNPKWIRIVNPVFQFMNTIPGYSEFDISSVFLIFFSLFFAMLVGDAGYGALFILITFIARRKFKKAPYEPFFLMYLLGGATMVWGAITGTWFGSEAISQLPGLKSLIIGKISSFAGNDQNFVIFLCFIIGAVQLTIAHMMKAFRVINSVRALADIGWAMIVWGMFFAAGKFVIARPFPAFAGWLLSAGITLVLVFSNPQKNMFKGMLTTLANLPLSVIGAFSDVVSYLRLFAVGYASVVLASTFNNMALSGGINNVLAGLSAAIILFLGHALNITLCMMAVVVHGIRLNMLEFSGHLGMQWSGNKYEPFCEK
jgi:V/A-type H+-transporting ATPase subunit I